MVGQSSFLPPIASSSCLEVCDCFPAETARYSMPEHTLPLQQLLWHQEGQTLLRWQPARPQEVADLQYSSLGICSRTTETSQSGTCGQKCIEHPNPRKKKIKNKALVNQTHLLRSHRETATAASPRPHSQNCFLQQFCTAMNFLLKLHCAIPRANPEPWPPVSGKTAL